MLPHCELKALLMRLPYDVVKTNKKVEYIDLPCGFDIETSSITVGDQKAAFMYIWQLGIAHGTGVFYGRTWDEFITTCSTIQNHFELHENRRLVIYVHNLGYEFQFMRKHFKWLDIFAIGERKPLKILCEYGIEFRDSLILSGNSLENTARNLVKYKIKKAVDDLDYTLTRTHHTPLTDLEIGYCKNDIVIITAYIQEQIDHYGDVTKIPLTNTGRVRTVVRNNCYYSSTNHRKSNSRKYGQYRKQMLSLTMDAKIHDQLSRAFMGGFTHANANHTGDVLESISSIDFTSSYPAVMVSEKFPMSRFRSIELESTSQLDDLCMKHCVLFNAIFTNIRPKITQDNYLSSSKTYILENPVINNGRVVSADKLGTTITDVDYSIMKQAYEWDDIQVNNVNYSYSDYLPKAIVESVLIIYQDKTELKGVKGRETDYMLSKGMLNSIYGMCVTSTVKDDALYDEDEGWYSESVDVNEALEADNIKQSRFLYYPWGVWITAYARRNLFTGIFVMGEDYIYSDTDSIKVKNIGKYTPYMEWYDAQIIKKMETVCDHYKLDKELLHPKTLEGDVKTLGIWDYEGTHTRFKTLGSKRYLSETNGKLEITVAGLSKQNGVKYMLEQCNNDNTLVFDMFSDNLHIPADETGKLTHTYIDDELKFNVTDYQNKTATVNPLSGQHLAPCEFTLSISEQQRKFLTEIGKGYIMRAIQYV